MLVPLGKNGLTSLFKEVRVFKVEKHFSFLLLCFEIREWPRYCRKVYWTKMVQNGPNDHFGQHDLNPNWILAFARPKWTKMVHFGLKRSVLVHLGPPAVLWPFLRDAHAVSTTSGCKQPRRIDRSDKVCIVKTLLLQK